ncbi:MAG: hypothetical protein R3D58_06995 [Saprospiraceae bacterium]|nr:hypothetical protein [Lewinellaceae bacterium]
MQIQYSTDELVHMITTNNLPGVYTRLVNEGRVDGAIPPNVDAISYAIQEQAGRLSPEAFLAWVETLLDVPVNQSRVYARELTAIRQTTGKTPARLVADQIRDTMPNQPGLNRYLSGVLAPKWISWLIIGLAVLGLFCVLRLAGRMIGKVTG